VDGGYGPKFSALISPPAIVLFIAVPISRHGRVRVHGEALSPEAETQVTGNSAQAGAADSSKTSSTPATITDR
jgi:hypothetical protein